MKRENILITENHTEKRVAAVKFVAPGDVPAFDCSIHFGEENDVTMKNCIIKGNRIVKCSPDDTYDFETGTLIALMKMCGAKKAAEACCEAFPNETSGSIYRENKQYRKRIKELEKENKELHKNIDELFEDGKHAKSEVARLSFKNHRLEEENEKLKLDCERLQHGYIDTDMIFCGGRQNGKQYTFLVDLFKKIDQKKVDAAYKEAYNTKLPLWQKEVFKQMCDMYEAGKFNKPPTKREEMWNDILTCGDCERSKYIEVKKEDLETFAKECNEKKIFSISGYEFHLQKYWFDNDNCIFQIFRKPSGFICATNVSFAPEDTLIDYLPPMRWDLFKKGRIVVGVRREQYEEFKEEITKQFGIINTHKPYDNFNYSFFIYDSKYAKFVESIGRSQFRAIKEMNNHKVVYWEDVR